MFCLVVVSDLYVASPVEEYLELCHQEEGGLSEEEQNLTQLITRASHIPASMNLQQPICLLAGPS